MKIEARVNVVLRGGSETQVEYVELTEDDIKAIAEKKAAERYHDCEPPVCTDLEFSMYC